MTYTELHEAALHEDSDKVIQLARSFPEQAMHVDDHGLTPLHILLLGNPNPFAVQALLEASPNACSDQDVHGDTPLHLACGNPEMQKHTVLMLLEACPTAASLTNREGLMPLHCACRYAPSNELVIGLLVEHYPYALLSQIKVCHHILLISLMVLKPSPT
jgi:ankyrin repeat protein